jgi:hypothetical protein
MLRQQKFMSCHGRTQLAAETLDALRPVRVFVTPAVTPPAVDVRAAVLVLALEVVPALVLEAVTTLARTPAREVVTIPARTHVRGAVLVLATLRAVADAKVAVAIAVKWPVRMAVPAAAMAAVEAVVVAVVLVAALAVAVTVQGSVVAPVVETPVLEDVCGPVRIVDRFCDFKELMMEPITFQVRAAETDSFYERNRALCKLMLQESIVPEDFTICQRMRQGNRFSRCFAYLSVFQNPNTKDFIAWSKYIENVICAMALACEKKFESDAEKKLFSYALAVNTFPDGALHIKDLAPFDNEELQKIASLSLDSDERILAMYVFGNAILGFLSKDQSRELHTFLQLLAAFSKANEQYAAVDGKMPHFDDMRIDTYGKIE